MLYRLSARGDVLFENVFDEVNAAARPFEFVAGEQVGGAGGIAKAAVDAGAQDFFGRFDFWVLEQMGGNGRAHRSVPFVSQPAR